MARKIIQIATLNLGEGDTTMNEVICFALCDDGALYYGGLVYEPEGPERVDKWRWDRVEQIPQGDEE
jgi:hypothetical protein